MDTNFLKECVGRIKVRNLVNEDVEVTNESPLEMIGKGRQGAVFNVTGNVCVKVFGNTEDCDREFYALSLGQHTKLFPKVYHKGPLHIAMEMIRGVDLREYLQSQPLSKELAMKLIDMLIIFKEIGYERIDHHKRQIYLQADGSLKVIDVARTVWRDRVYPYPRKLLNSLGNENKKVFLAYVKELSPALYEEWQHYIRMEELAQEIYQVLLEDPNKKEDMVPTLSDKLLTRSDEDRYVVLMAGLMHKVYKEQWVKTMIARGADPDKVIEKIDEYWDEKKREYKQMTEAAANDQNGTSDGDKDGGEIKVDTNKNITGKGATPNKDLNKKLKNATESEKNPKGKQGKQANQTSDKSKHSKWWSFGLL